jgi:hypothetical protein
MTLTLCLELLDLPSQRVSIKSQLYRFVNIPLSVSALAQ